jgi:hypothetical protein
VSPCSDTEECSIQEAQIMYQSASNIEAQSVLLK